MLKRVILWIVPLLIVAVFAVSFVVAPMMSSSAATRHVVDSNTPTATATSTGPSTNVIWNNH